jgi:protein-disulfide isomerase
VTDELRGEAELAERRRRRLWLLGASFVMVAVLVAIAIALGGGGDEAGTTTGKPEGTAEVLELYEGIPQRGVELGNPSAPYTLTEFADLQCPFCGEYARNALPAVVRRYVRTGKLKLVFRSLKFIGEDSEEAARMAQAAGQQGRLFQFVELVYRNQGAEETGWVDDEYLRRIAAAVGIDVERAMAARDSAAVTAELDRAIAEGKAAKVESTPWFLIAKAGGKPRRLEVEALTAGAVTEALDTAMSDQ